ncbi:MAG: GNAT family N-acetyltransferase [Actinobacteria bacterium]|nr:GNAT family N-acetyltransferase [Actinomycetota bacterium]
MVSLSDESWNRLLETERLELIPLEPHHADELVIVLEDVRLYQFTGGEAAGLEDLRRQYERWSTRVSPDGTQRWLNWVINRRDDARALGTVQATVVTEDSRLVADVAWIVGVEHQGQGYASEAADAMIRWLFGCGVVEIVAHVHPAHAASGRVAAKLGMMPTEEWLLGERRWRISMKPPPSS